MYKFIMHISGPFLGHSLVSRSTWPQASSRRAPRCQPFLRPKFLSPPPPCPHDTAGLSVAIVCHFRSVRETGSHSFPIGFFRSASCFLRFIPRKESSFVSFFLLHGIRHRDTVKLISLILECWTSRLVPVWGHE